MRDAGLMPSGGNSYPPEAAGAATKIQDGGLRNTEFRET